MKKKPKPTQQSQLWFGKKPSTLSPVQATAKLSKKQIELLSQRLDSTSNNVYRVGEQLFGFKPTDAIFNRLQNEQNLFRCEECSIWCDESLRDPDYINTCCNCANEMKE